MRPKLSDLWRWSSPIDGSVYLFWGVLLATIKFNLDRAIAYFGFDQSWSVFKWSTIRLYLWQSPWEKADQPYYLALLLVSVPFVWIGTALTLRRLKALGWNPAWVLLFFVPVAKLFLFLVLGVVRSRADQPTKQPSRGWVRWVEAVWPANAFGSALMAVVLTAALASVLAWVGTEIFKDYGWSIFVGLPFCMGLLAALIHGVREARSLASCIAVANTSVLLVGTGLLLFALEGILCIVMAAPIAFAVASTGGVMGYAVQKSFAWRANSPRLFCSIILLVPLTMGLEHVAPPKRPVLRVESSVIVNASQEKVWRHVVAFAELPPPKEMIFRLGIAYPIRADITGTGVGAVRRCNFSTGPFVEPIEVWDEPRLLKFSVTQNPEPMQEWTLYREIHPAHLDCYLESRAGQFRLVPLAGGRTLLEGTTWYYHRLWPADYWQLWSDYIIHTIHLRVLDHVKQLSERSAP